MTNDAVKGTLLAKMEFYLLNSGRRRVLFQELIQRETFRPLKSLVVSGGLIPSPFGGFSVEVAIPTEARCSFSGATPIHHHRVGLDRGRNGKTRDSLKKTYLFLCHSLLHLMSANHLPIELPEVPWIGMILVPGFHNFAKNTWPWIGDFACSFGWTLPIERSHQPI